MLFFTFITGLVFGILTMGAITDMVEKGVK